MMGQLEGQVAIVTGGGTGIGRETARRLAAEGARVIVVGRRQSPLDLVVGEIEAAGGQAVARQADVSSLDEAAYVNLNGIFALTRAVLPTMVERGGGTVVTVTSLAALRPGLISGAAYGAAKAAARNFMQFVHTTLRDRGIRATTIVPAEVDTPILDARPHPPDAKARATMMQSDDVARAILFCVTLPSRTVVEEIVMSPTMPRDPSAEIATARRLGEPAARGPVTTR